MTTIQKCVLALAHRAKPKQTVERLDEAEREELSAIWDTHGETLGADFEKAFADFWCGHLDRLESLKATVDDEEETEIVDE